MKIRYSLIGIMVFLCLFFLGSLILFHHVMWALILITLGFYTLTSVLFYLFFIKPIERLNKDLSNIQAGVIEALKTNTANTNEFSEIASRINILLETIKLARQQLYFLSNESKENIELPITSIYCNHQNARGINLPDRAFFNASLNKTMSYVKRHNKLAAILIINVELTSDAMDMKTNLDSPAINEIAHKFSSVLRKEDLLAKLDGNEFIVLLEDIRKPKFASAVAEKLLQVLSKGICVNSEDLSLRTSIGISICPHDASSLEESIEKTYTALYRVKSVSGSHYQFYTNELDIEAHEYINMKNALQKAVQDNELILYYQPKYDLKKNSIIGVEVLVRWLHPSLGLLAPEKFLDVAEDSGSIIAIGEWALREACRVNTYWQNEGYEHLTIALNVSTKQFFNPKLSDTLTIILNETKLNPNYLELEINEETIMSDLEKASGIMKNIADLGVQISLDHFGKGYTSISHLKHLPISTLKIDREFIHGVALNPNDSAITSAIIALSHYLGMFALAEGVENAEQLQFLAQQHCDRVQGYFLCYPLPAQDVVQHFKKISDSSTLAI